MRKPLFLFAMLLFGLTGWTQKTIVHDPNAQVRQIKGYHGIEVSDAIDLYLSHGDEETVVVSARDIRWRDRIRTEVEDGILRISLPDHGLSLGNLKLKAYVSFTTLDRLTASGASDVFVDGVIAGDELSISLSGASDFKGAVRVRKLRMEQSGASDAHLTGAVSGLVSIHSTGASNIKGYDLVTESCDVHASGAADIHITVNKELSADLSGASNVYYKGNGVIRETHSSGASNIKKVS
ncbi:MAG TPA: head GIN domain-containing protein [Puia sp.]|nr:head GIN domain-containing protein [Puia sp.]